MMPALKLVLPLSDTSYTAGATATAIIDTFDSNTGVKYDFLCIGYKEATVNVVSNKPTVLALSQSDITDATGFTNISGFVGGTDFTIANGNTSATSIRQFNVDARARKRYIKLTVSPATTQIVGVFGALGRGKQSPATATLAGVQQLIEG